MSLEQSIGVDFKASTTKQNSGTFNVSESVPNPLIKLSKAREYRNRHENVKFLNGFSALKFKSRFISTASCY
jgi:hypothetical protein